MLAFSIPPVIRLRLAGVSVSEINAEYGQDISFRNARRSPASTVPGTPFPGIKKKQVMKKLVDYYKMNLVGL